VQQLIFLKTPPHAAVHTSVELTRLIGHAKLAALVNAVLNRVVREGEAYVAAQDAARFHLPPWLIEGWIDAYGEPLVRAMAAAQLCDPPLDIYVREDAHHWANALEGEVVFDHTVRRSSARVAGLPGYAEGQWWVQDVAASLPVLLLGDVQGKRVADLCAAPGGKSLQLAVKGAEVTAVDRSAARMQRLKENAARMQVKITAVISDVLHWKPPVDSIDAVLLDAPGSATGTIRRHPDLLFLKSRDDVEYLTTLQADMLDYVAAWLPLGATLVYCVCSLEPQEGEEQILRFLERNASFDLVPIQEDEMPAEWVRGGMLRTLPCHLKERGGMDGFFAARLRRMK